MSATVYNLILAPKDLVASVSESKFKDEDGNLDEDAYNAEIDVYKRQMCTRWMWRWSRRMGCWRPVLPATSPWSIRCPMPSQR